MDLMRIAPDQPAGITPRGRISRAGTAFRSPNLCLALIPVALALAGCESTSRFDGGLFGSRPVAPVAT
ncbi:MAG: hypothetical protein ACRED3_17905, partial [Bradyrhizobium sp.]